MSSHRELVQAQIAEALKARDTARLSTLRLLLSEVKNKAIELGEEVSEDDFLRVVHKGIKQRQESAKQYREGGRDELAAKEQAVGLADGDGGDQHARLRAQDRHGAGDARRQ